MSLTTDNGKMAVMEWCQSYEPGFMLTETTPFSQADKQQLIWGIPEVLWDDVAPAPAPAPAAVTEDTGGGSGGSWPSLYEQNRKRRKLIEEDDQLIMDMISQSLTEIMKYYD